MCVNAAIAVNLRKLSTCRGVFIAAEMWQIVRALHWKLVAEIKKKQSHQRHEDGDGRQDTHKLRRDWGEEDKAIKGEGKEEMGEEKKWQTEEKKTKH